MLRFIITLPIRSNSKFLKATVSPEVFCDLMKMYLGGFWISTVRRHVATLKFESNCYWGSSRWKEKLSRGEIYRRVNPISLSKTQADRGHQGWDASLSPWKWVTGLFSGGLVWAGDVLMGRQKPQLCWEPPGHGFLEPASPFEGHRMSWLWKQVLLRKIIKNSL